MFRSISENPHQPGGKRSSEVSRQMKATQYELGRQEWHEKWQSQTKDGFAKPVDPPKYQRAQKIVGSQICFGSDKVDFLSNTKSNFTGPPSDFQRAKPMRDKATLMQSSYTLGTDPMSYTSAAHTQFQHPHHQPSKAQPAYRNYNQRVDIITGALYGQNKRGAAFEGYSEDPQHKKSGNQTKYVPADLYVEDPITGRKLIRKSGIF